MKSKILSILTALAFIWSISGCHEPYEFSPTHFDTYFTSVTAFFPDNTDDVFPAEIDNVNHVVTLVIPYTYPYNTENYLEMQDITHMKVLCNLNQGYTMTPAMPPYLDLSTDNVFTVTDNYGVNTRFTFRGEIRKSSDCRILEYTLATTGNGALVDNENHVLTFITAEPLGKQLAQVELPHGATMDPDPTVTEIDYDADPTVTVIAQDGVTKASYTFATMEPTKIPAGIREGSAKVIWARKHSDVGLAVYSGADMSSSSNLRFHGSAGLGTVGDKLVINDAGTGKAYVLNYKNGALISTIDLSALGTNNLGHYNNWRMTSDDSGNLIFASSPWNNGGALTIWKMHGLDGQLEKVITYANSSAIGSQLSITGCIDGDAIITSSQNGSGAKVYRWVIRGGVPKSQTPDILSPSCYTGTSWGQLDTNFLSTDENSDYITIGYAGKLNPLPDGSYDRSQEGVERCAVMHNNDGSVKSYGSQLIGVNSVENAGDLCEFNNAKFYAHNILNTLGYAANGNSLRIYDISGGNMSMAAADLDPLVKNKYGSNQATAIYAKGSNGNDVRFYVSEDGFYLYLFFDYTNGYVGAVRFDCIDM